MAAVAALTVTAVAPAASASPAVAAGSGHASLDGYWQMDGYGLDLQIGGGVLQLLETTAVSCLPGLRATQAGPVGADGAVTFVDTDQDVLHLRLGTSRGTGAMDIDGSFGERHLRRLSALPDRCSRPAPADPRSVFDVYWQTFAENYPFFAAKGVDWQQVRARYRPQVTSATTDTQLFAILAAMIAPLNDAHTALRSDTEEVTHLRPGTVDPTPAYDQRITAFVEHRDVKGPLQEWGGGKIGFAELPGRLGYLRVSAFAGPSQAGDFASDSAVLDQALDAIFTPARTQGPDALTGLIIDLRVNSGGSDVLGVQIASRLTGRPYTAYAKVNRDDPRDPSKFTAPQPIPVIPADAPRYLGPIAVLIGGSTVSAGETFTQSLLARTPRPVLIGQNTQGVFSDVMIRQLPDGWAFALPNEEYRTADGRTFDGTGIPPDIRTPVFTDREFAQNLDSAFDRAVAALTRVGTSAGPPSQ